MGATTFVTTSKGSTVQDAFNNAREEASNWAGDEGYTGTIAEKRSFVMIPFNLDQRNQTPIDYAYFLLDEGDYRIDDKWGPAGCIDLKDGSYLFFGWASE